MPRTLSWVPLPVASLRIARVWRPYEIEGLRTDVKVSDGEGKLVDIRVRPDTRGRSWLKVCAKGKEFSLCRLAAFAFCNDEKTPWSAFNQKKGKGRMAELETKKGAYIKSD